MLARLRELWDRLRGTVERNALERDMDEEFQFHLQKATERNLRRGMEPAEAKLQALRSFGGVERVKEAARDEQRTRWLEDLVQDVQYGARSLRKHPGHAAATILTVALGIAANTAIFSVFNGVLLRPLPYPEPERVVHLGWQWGRGGGRSGSLSPYQFEFIRENARVFAGVATFRTFETELGDPASFATVLGLRVSHDFFQTTGISPVLGRTFDERESAPGGSAVVILGDALWQREFGGSADAIGKSILIGGTSHTVVGVMPPGFRVAGLPAHTDAIVPLRLQADPGDEGLNYTVMTRLLPDVTFAEATADLSVVSASFRAANPQLGAAREGGHVRLMDYQDIFVGQYLRTTLWVLLGAVGFVLLIACANAANLLLARAIGREREMALRAAIGAGRGRIVRQLLAENLLLCMIAGVIGLAIGRAALDLILVLVPREIPRLEEIGLDIRVLAFTFGIATLTGIVFGLTGALPASRPDLLHALRTGGRTSTSTRKRARDFLIVGETALAVVLLTGAGLLITSFARLSAVDPGFDAENLLAVRFSRMPRTYSEKESRVELTQQLLERVRAIPGVERAALLSSFPLERGYNMAVTVDGRDDEAVSVEWRSVTPDVFETLRIPLVRGRAFSDADRAGAARVTIINEAFANRFWPGESPIGKQIAIGRYNGRWTNPDAAALSEVIGVISDIREVDLRRSAIRTAYVPDAQAPVGMMSAPKLVVRTSQQVPLHAAITEAVHAIDPLIPPPDVETISDIVGRSIAQDRFRMVLLSAFAASALLLTAIGIYGLIAYSVRQQVREIGIRMVLGAQAGRVLISIVGRGLILVGAGIVIGIVSALGLTRLLSSVLFGVSATNAMTFLQVVAVLGVTALLAAYLPARRATRVAPTVTLTSE